MRFASSVTRILLAAALWLPYATPVLCSSLVPHPVAAHEACGDRPAESALAPMAAGPTCDLGSCPLAPTAPPGGDLAELAVVPAVDVKQPEPAPAIAGQSLAPPTPPPLL